MREQDLRYILGGLGILPGRTNRKGWMQFPCPLAPWTHTNKTDSSPSAAALAKDDGPSSFVCKACHHKGPVAKLARLLADFSGNADYRQWITAADRAEAQASLNIVYSDFDQPLSPPDPEPLAEVAYGDLYPPVDTSTYEAVEYLTGRGISLETAARIDLRWDPDQRRVVFPVRDGTGALYGFTGRAIDPGVKLRVKDYLGLPKEFVILGEHRWRDGYPKIIVEGLFAYAWLHELGIEETADVGALLGSAMTAHKAQRIIHADCKTFLLLDNDAGGDLGLFGTVNPQGGREQNGAVHYLHGHVPLYIPAWPEGKDDPDQLTRPEVDEMLARSPLFSVDQKAFDKKWVQWV